ncbi:Pentatricopeptide repeat-containing protein [Actinidia chinensis var. chinensis]|uniref:Pentatricopeptide repeat-containing protein n=1 Tax=Actinidia chinensis var. chinensis TaxID=1590841 RepID=A0A2R6RGN8_ACTCC|nr:Pentatricopeptide repeat-containing protein [Actinidia chinensis var. chinensis]
MQLWNSNHSRTNFLRFLNPILCIVRREHTIAAASFCSPLYLNQSEAWFVKVVCILCIRRTLDVFDSDYFCKNLSPVILFDSINQMNSSFGNPKLAFEFFEFTRVKLNLIHSSVTYDLLMRSLCEMGLHDLAKLVFEYMRVDGRLRDSSSVGFLVLAFAHACKFDIVKGLFSQAERENVKISSFVYNDLLALLVKQNQVQEAVCFFRDHILRSKCYRPDTCTFNIVIRGLCRVGEVDKAFAFFNEMGSFGCLPDVITYVALINGLCRVGEADRGLELLREFQLGKGFSPDVITYTSVISGYCKLGNMEVASNIYDEMIKSGIKPTSVTFNVLIDGHGKNGDMSHAVNTYEKMLCLGCLPDVVTFTSLIDGYCRSGQLDQGLRLWDEMNLRNLAPNVYTFAVLINALCKENRLNEARDLLRQLRWREDIVPRPFIYNPVIDRFCKAGNVEEANLIVAEMDAKRCNPDKVTFTILIFGHCMKGRMAEAINIYNKMLAIGCAPDQITLNSLTSCLLKAGMPDEAFRIMQTASEDLNLGMSSLRGKIAIKTNMDIPVAV